MTGGAVRRNPFSLLSKGEKIGQDKMLSSMPKGENVENSCQLMSKEFKNDKTSENDARGIGSMKEEKDRQSTNERLYLNPQKDQRLRLNPHLVMDQ